MTAMMILVTRRTRIMMLRWIRIVVRRMRAICSSTLVRMTSTGRRGMSTVIMIMLASVDPR
eukprot:6512451-Pyramimonas_sp.AAC.1